jgi:hypothetical protein
MRSRGQPLLEIVGLLILRFSAGRSTILIVSDHVSSAKNVFIFRKNSGLFKNTNSLSNQEIEFRRASPSPLPPHDRYCDRVFGYRIYCHETSRKSDHLGPDLVCQLMHYWLLCHSSGIYSGHLSKRAAKRTLQDKYPRAKNIVRMNHASFHLFPIATRKALRHYQPTAEWRHIQAPLETKWSATYLWWLHVPTHRNVHD